MNTEQESNQDPVIDGKVRKIGERSAAYPAYTLEYFLTFTGEVYKHFRNNFGKREDILSLIKGAHPSKIAAAGHYGLLVREKDTYKVTELYKTITNYLTAKEKKDALLTAFISPNLNAELVEKFDGDVLPENLYIHLFRFHRISEAAAPAAADVFISNAKYVGVLSDSNKLCYASALDAPVVDSGGRVIVDFPEEKSGNQSAPVPSPANIPELTTPLVNETQPVERSEIKQPLLLTEIAGEEKLPIKLTDGKRAYLTYPKDLREKDIAILKLQLEALALTL